MADESGKQASPQRPDQDVMILTELDQIKVLADPLRVRILEQLQEEKTTKQIAELIGEKPTKLYHHMEALVRVGLIGLTRTRQNRGTLEKYYRAMARSFRADSRAFCVGPESTDDEKDTLLQMVRTIFDSTASEIRGLVESGRADSLEDDGILSFVDLRADEEHIQELRKRLMATLEWLSSLAEDGDEDIEGLPRYRLTMAFYPLESPPGVAGPTD